MTLALLLALAPAAALPAGDEAFRAAFTELLRSSDAAARPALVEKALAAAPKELDALRALAALGPIVPADPAKAAGAQSTVGGRAATIERFGSVLSGFAFDFDGAPVRYAVDVPAGYDATKPVALLLDPGHATGRDADAKGKADFLAMYRRHADESGHRDWLVARTEIVEQLGADGLRGERPEDEVVLAFDAFLRDVATRFAVDLDRVYVAGLSQTGFWAWMLGRERADRLAGIAPMSAVTWEVDGALENLRDLPVFALHGSDDPVCPVAQPRATIAALLRLGASARYLEVAGAKHDYAVWGRLPEALKELGKRSRVVWPKRVAKGIAGAHDRSAAWIRIDALDAAASKGTGRAGAPIVAGVDAEVEGNAIRLWSSGVERVELHLARELVDLAEPVEVRWNGAVVHSGKVTPSARDLLEAAGTTGDWKRLAEARLVLEAPPARGSR